MANLAHDPDYFLTLQTKTGWGRALAKFADWCAPAPGWRVLDAGCGPGLLPALFASAESRAGRQAFGTDLDPDMFRPEPLHPQVAAADILALPFPSQTFNLVTASNLLFLLPGPAAALEEMVRAVKPGGQVCLLNPSEKMNLKAAQALADRHKLEGLARDTLLNYAARAEKHHRWDVNDLAGMMQNAGLRLTESILHMGDGLVRFARGNKQ